MSIIMLLKQAPAATLDLLVERPEFAINFWTHPGFTPAKPPGWVVWLTRLLGGKSPTELPESPHELARNGETLDLDQGWHALQWLLTKPKSQTEGDEWQVPPPEGTLLAGGEPIVGSDHGYGDERAVDPQDVAAFDALLRSTPWKSLEARIDPEAMESAQVYPTGWHEPDRREWLEDLYGKLQTYVSETKAESLGFVVKLS